MFARTNSLMLSLVCLAESTHQLSPRWQLRLWVLNMFTVWRCLRDIHLMVLRLMLMLLLML